MTDISIELFMSSIAIFLIARQIWVPFFLIDRLEYDNRVLYVLKWYVLNINIINVVCIKLA